MQRETVWLRRLLLLESFAPVPGLTAAMVRLLVLPNKSHPVVCADGEHLDSPEQVLQYSASPCFCVGISQLTTQGPPSWYCQAVTLRLKTCTAITHPDILQILYSCARRCRYRRASTTPLPLLTGSLRQSTLEPGAGRQVSAGVSAGERQCQSTFGGPAISQPLYGAEAAGAAQPGSDTYPALVAGRPFSKCQRLAFGTWELTAG